MYKRLNVQKYLVFLAAIAIIAGLLALSGCARINPDLVGEWVYEADPSWKTTFNEDGTGTHTQSWGFGTTFTWLSSSRNLYWNYPGHQAMYTPYSISGNVLTITISNGSTFRYIKNP